MNPESNRREADEPDETLVNGGRGWLLCRGVKGILRCDEAEVVAGIARYVISQYRSLRVGTAFAERTRGTLIPPVLALLGALTRFLEVREGERRDGAVWVARLSNERHAIEPLTALLPELDWTELKLGKRPDAAALSALSQASGKGLGSNWRGVLKLARRLHGRYEFFKVLRVAEMVGYYTRYLRIFREGRFRLALMSSHSNPHGIAFNLAARRCGVPVVLVTHGMPVRPVARLSYDLALVHCEAARQTYLEEGCRMNRVLIHGRRQHHTAMPVGPMPERVRVGLFLCKDVNEGRLRVLVERLLAHPRVSDILVRPHPKNLWLGLDEWVESLNDSRVRRGRAGAVSGDIEASDIVLAGNSSVLVDAVTAGRPSGYVPGIDYGPTDLHAFVARGLIPQFGDGQGFDPDVMLRFYRRPEWPAVLSLFANVEESEATVAARFGDALRELAASRGADDGGYERHERSNNHVEKKNA